MAEYDFTIVFDKLDELVSSDNSYEDVVKSCQNIAAFSEETDELRRFAESISDPGNSSYYFTSS